jgi:hypothetical protein
MLKLTLSFALLFGALLAPAALNGKNESSICNRNKGFTLQVDECGIQIHSNEMDHCISPQVLHKVILAALDVWTNETYGHLRSAYNHGELDVYYSSEHSVSPNQPAYYVAIDGNEICVIINI